MSNVPNKVIYSMIGVSKYYDKKPVLKDIYLSYFYGAKIGVIGLNGSGKSSLLRILAGVDQEFQGKTAVSPGYTIGFLEQEPQLDPSKDGASDRRTGRAVHRRPASRIRSDQRKVCRADVGRRNERRCSSGKEKCRKNSMRSTPGISIRGSKWRWTRFVVLPAIPRSRSSRAARSAAWGSAGLLLQKPDILLLDEPTNHLDAESVAWLEQHIQKYEGTVIAVTHDRYFLDNVAGWILELDRGHGIPWEGQLLVMARAEETSPRAGRESRNRAQKTLQRELDWIRMSPKGEARERQGAHQRVRIFAAIRKPTSRVQELEIYIPPGPRLGQIVIEADHVRKAYGDRILVDDMNFRLPAGGIVGVIGPNGAGKTTLFRMITGAGTSRRGYVQVRRNRQAWVTLIRARDTLDAEQDRLGGDLRGQDIVPLGTRR